MVRMGLYINRALTILIVGMVAVAPTLADKPAWAGSDKHETKGEGRGRDRGKGSTRLPERGGAVAVVHFSEQHRAVVRDYYVGQFKGGRCPPGLAKKRNGCMPPGQAKKWQVGRPLPRDVVFYDLPQVLVVELGLPPTGHRFVRVAADILLIAVGTGMVIDAIEDLGRM